MDENNKDTVLGGESEVSGVISCREMDGGI